MAEAAQAAASGTLGARVLKRDKERVTEGEQEEPTGALVAVVHRD